MFKNYFITTIRTYFISKKIGNRSFFTYINLIGLIIGLAAFLIIAHLVRYELSYDKFFPNAKNIYRVTVEKIQNGESTMESAKTYPGVGGILKNEVKETESFARVLKEECMLHYKPTDIKFNRQFTYWADKSFLSMFGLEFIEKADTSTFDNPYNCVLSQTTAERYFGKNWEGDKTPIGKTIHLNESLPFIIQGVYKDLPANSHMEVDFIVSYSTLVALVGPDCETGMPPFGNINYTYVSLKPGASYKQVEELAQKALASKIPASATSDAQYHFSLQPLTSIHLNSHLTDELKPNGNRTFVLALSLAAILILVVAWINFINLATARALNRAKEVGVRKAIGSSKKQLVSQFVFEALFASVLAAIGAVIVVFFFSGRIEKMAGIPDSVFAWKGEAMYSWFLFLGIMLAGGLLSSIYPAFILSSFKPVEVLKGKVITSGGKGFFRKGLISFQFFFAVFLLCCTGAIYYQVKYMREQSLGLTTEQVLVLHSPRSMIGSKKRIDNFKTFRQSLLQYPAIEKVGSSAVVPGDQFLKHWEGVQQIEKDNGKHLTYDVAWVDEGYLPTLDIKLVAGRNFIDQPGEEKKIIPNETAIKALGFTDSKEAIGKIIRAGNNKEYEIAGVTGDAHYEGLQKNIRPVLLLHGHNYEFGFFSMKVNGENMNQTIANVQRHWNEIYPNDPFDYFFLDSFFEKQYHTDQKFGKVFGLFSFLAIFIACLGLIGLVAYTTYQKTKEIGIRKVLGASLGGIVALITKEFSKPILIACLVAIPVSHLIISKWLDGFAYRAQFAWWMYVLPLLLIVALAFFAISFQSLKAAMANPVNSLREE
jgi:putative ABC transport system permease protein